MPKHKKKVDLKRLVIYFFLNISSRYSTSCLYLVIRSLITVHEEPFFLCLPHLTVFSLGVNKLQSFQLRLWSLWHSTSHFARWWCLWARGRASAEIQMEIGWRCWGRLSETPWAVEWNWATGNSTCFWALCGRWCSHRGAKVSLYSVLVGVCLIRHCWC